MDAIIEEFINLDYINEDILFYQNSWAKNEVTVPNINSEQLALTEQPDDKQFKLCEDFTISNKILHELGYNQSRLSHRVLTA